MIPVLSNNTTLTGNGIGHLTDALSCVITHEINGEYELRMRYPVTGVHYSDIAENLIIWAEPDNMTSQQAFRIYRVTRPLNNIVTIYARHIAYDMSGIVVKPFSANSLTTALTAIASNCSPSCPFTFATTRSVATGFQIVEPTVLWQMLGGIQGSLLDIYGGEWDFDNLTANFVTSLGSDRGVSIRYGKNMTELEQDLTIESTYAGVFPFWYDEESNTLVKLTADYISIPGATGSRLLLLDCSDDFDTAPSEAQLTTKANAYITANAPGDPKISWKINMAMLGQSTEFSAALEQVMLGDTIHVFYEPMNLTATSRAVKLEYDVLLERYKSITLGRVKQNLAKIVADNQKETAAVIKGVKSSFEDAVAHATDFIKNGTGYMRFIYDSSNNLTEIISMDNPDIDQAQKVWRWNNGGFGYSSTGYNGTYGLAITQDGQIVADFITTGTMAGNRIRTGLIEDETHTNYWNLDTGELNIQALKDFGGRNILLNSATMHPYQVGGSTVTFTDNVSVGEWSCVDAHRAVGVGGSGIVVLMFYGTSQSSTAYIANQKYALSIYIKNNDSKPIYVLANGMSGGAADAISVAAGEAKRCEFFVTGNGNTYIQIQIRTATAGDTYDFTWWHPQIEYGEVVTSWNPAPEDKVGNDEIISKINVSPEQVLIQSNKINLVGAVSISSFNNATQAALLTGTAAKNQYYISTSSSSATGGTWADTTAAWSSGKYVWTRVVTTKTYADGTSTTTNGTAVYDANLTSALETGAANTANMPIVNLLPSVYQYEYQYGKTWTYGGITWTVNADGSITATGTATANSRYIIAPSTLSNPVPGILIDKTKKYYLSGCPSGGGATTYLLEVRLFNADGTGGAYNADYGSGRLITPISTTQYMQCYAVVISGTALPTGGVTFNPMLEVGDTAHAYVSTHNGSGAIMTKAIESTVSCYYRSTTSTTPTISTSTSIGTAVDTSNAWEYVMPRPKNGCYFFTCERYTHGDGSVTFSTVRQLANATYTSLWCSSADSTYIDGGQIYTGTVNANAIKANETFTQKLYAQDFNISGGSVNIQTASSTEDKIVLNYSTESTHISAHGFQAIDSSVTYGDPDRAVLLSCDGLRGSDIKVSSTPSYVQGFYLYDGHLTLRAAIDSNTSYNQISLNATDGSIFVYHARNKYSALMWPDSNGAGRFVLGDGTSTLWRTQLDNTGLTFRDSSDAVTASYPATGWPTTLYGGSWTTTTSWSDTGYTASIPGATDPGWYIIEGVHAYNNARPKGIAVGGISGGHFYAYSICDGAIIGDSVSSASCCRYLNSNVTVGVYAKAGTAGVNNGIYIRVHRIM